MGSQSVPPMSTEEARARIREAGLRATPGRIAVLQKLVIAGKPTTHAELVEQLVTRGSDASTVFRALNDMAVAGIVHRMELGDHVWRYELNRDAADATESHPHFLCLDCGDITCLKPLDMRPINRDNRELKKIGKVTEVLLKGQCSSCQVSD